MDSQMPWSRHSEFTSHRQPSQCNDNSMRKTIRSNDSLEKASWDPRTTEKQSQPSQSIDNGKRQGVRSNDSLEKASWDPRTTELFIRICVEELQAGNRPGSHFSRLSWENILHKFACTTILCQIHHQKAGWTAQMNHQALTL